MAEAFAPGARVAADVCRRHDVPSRLIYTWRRKLLDAGVAQEPVSTSWPITLKGWSPSSVSRR
ncbi:MAG: transposase [Erythrobacter sp.]|nr:transposase [Erythrobacter sp.]